MSREGFHDQDEHEGLPVKGYVPQSAANVAAVNEHKLIEERLLRLIEKRIGECKRGDELRWLSIAKTNIEQGFMALNRAVFMPTRINLPEDSA